MDVKGAFLLAPRKQTRRTLITRPPQILQQAGLCGPKERWWVKGALYGLNSSPADWATFRDKAMKTFRWRRGAVQFRLTPTSESNVWSIMGKKDGSGNGPVAETERWQVHGHLVVYVDDMMVCGPDTVVQGCLDRIASEWSCSPPEWVGRQDWTKFCGFELRWDDGGLLLGQPSYIGELVHRHGVQQSRPVPFSKPEVPESPEVNAVDIKEAQGLVGELLWLSVRTRADISLQVSWMAQHSTTGGEGCDGDDWVPARHTVTRADVSYAFGGGRSHQGVMAYYGGALVQWLSVRQAFTTLSTAEAELVGYLEAMTMGQSVAVVLGVLEGGAWDDLIIGWRWTDRRSYMVESEHKRELLEVAILENWKGTKGIYLRRIGKVREISHVKIGGSMCVWRIEVRAEVEASWSMETTPARSR